MRRLPTKSNERCARVEVVAEFGEAGHQESFRSFGCRAGSTASASLGRLALGDRLAASGLARWRPTCRRARRACGTAHGRGRPRRVPSGSRPLAGCPLEKKRVVASSCIIGWVNSTTMSTSMTTVIPSVKREPAHVADREHVEHDRGEQVDGLRREIVRSARFQPASTAPVESSAVAQLIPDSLEVDDERVDREADRDDQARDTGQRQAVADAPREDRDHEVGQDGGDDERGDRDSRARGTGRASRSTTRRRPIRPAMSPLLSCALPSVAEMVSWLCTSKLIGSAPNLSWSASAFAVSCVKLPRDLGLAVGDDRVRRRARR